MKKNLVSMRLPKRLALLTLSLAFLFTSCEDPNCIKGEGTVETRTLELSPFTKIEVNGDFKVYLSQGTVQHVEVKGEPNILSQLNTTISGNTWKIEHQACIRRSKNVEVYITMPGLQEVYLNGSGKVVGQNTFTVTELPLTINGSGNIALNVIAEHVIPRVIGSGEVELRGETERESVNISSSGKSKGFDLKADNVTVNISGSGVAEVSPTSTLGVQISGSGNVYYYGNPTVTSNISGSGKVIKK